MRTVHPFFEKSGYTLQEEEEAITSFFFISDYMYGGCLTFTAHLLHTLNRKDVFLIGKGLREKKKNFGYGIRYQNVPLEYFDSADNDISSSLICFSTLNAWKR